MSGTRWPRSVGIQGIEANAPAGRRRGLGPPLGGAFGSIWLAVDEHVVGLVGDVDDRRGLRVADAGRGDAAERVEAKHLDSVGQQPGGGADLGGVEVQLGDVAGNVGVLSDDRAGDRTAVGCLPLRRADLRATGELRTDLSDDDIADIIWSMNGPEYWTLLVSERGWSPGQFGNHLTDAWQRLFLAPAPRSRR